MPTHPISHISRGTLDLWPASGGEMIKPRELIEIRGAAKLTLNARRVYNLLVANAWGPRLGEPGAEFEISLSELRGSHAGNERIEDAIEALMSTIAVIRLDNGATRRVQLLGGNDLRTEGRRPGYLSYSFDHRLGPILQDSRMFGVLRVEVMHALASKHSLALYESLCRRVRLSQIFAEEISLDEFREMLAVEDGRLERYADLRRFAIEPAVAEINALADFSCRIESIKHGRRVGAVRLCWWAKSRDDYRAAVAEVGRSKIGRRARIRGAGEQVTDLAVLPAGSELSTS